MDDELRLLVEGWLFDKVVALFFHHMLQSRFHAKDLAFNRYSRYFRRTRSQEDYDIQPKFCSGSSNKGAAGRDRDGCNRSSKNNDSIAAAHVKQDKQMQLEVREEEEDILAFSDAAIEPYLAASERLFDLNLLMNPSEMVECVFDTCELIFTTASRLSSCSPHSIGADSLLPILMLVVVHANLMSAHCHLHYMKLFAPEALVAGERGYYLACLEAAIAAISREGVDELLKIDVDEQEQEQGWEQLQNAEDKVALSLQDSQVLGLRTTVRSCQLSQSVCSSNTLGMLSAIPGRRGSADTDALFDSSTSNTNGSGSCQPSGPSTSAACSPVAVGDKLDFDKFISRSEQIEDMIDSLVR